MRSPYIIFCVLQLLKHYYFFFAFFFHLKKYFIIYLVIFFLLSLLFKYFRKNIIKPFKLLFKFFGNNSIEPFKKKDKIIVKCLKIKEAKSIFNDKLKVSQINLYTE